MKKIALLAISLAVLVAFPITPAMAKSYFDLVTVAGPDWFGEIELTGSEIPESLVLGGFYDPVKSVSPPSDLGRGYLISRGYLHDGEPLVFDRMMYFPGSPGYVYYLEIVNGSGPHDGRWFIVAEEEGEKLLTALSADGAHIPSDAAKADLSAIADAPQPFDFVPMLGLAIAALLGGSVGWILRAKRGQTRLPGAS